MILQACSNLVNGIKSQTDGGNGIGRLQFLLGKGGTGKSFNLNAVITSLKQDLNFTSANYSK
jgi:excinuclease UvrABC helicase subunit UvrB